jgi:hypothetical protein
MTLFEKDTKKHYLYLHPIMGINDFHTNKENILSLFESFNEYIMTKTKNIFGIYFILLMQSQDVKSFKLKETENYSVSVVYCNDSFVDANHIFSGNCEVEEQEVLSVIKSIVLKE